VGETRNGVSGPDGAESPEGAADRLERQADVIRDELTGLVGELDHRRRVAVPRLQRLAKPLAVVAGASLVVGVVATWRRARRRRARRVRRR
jgi:hypothetical protein